MFYYLVVEVEPSHLKNMLVKMGQVKNWNLESSHSDKHVNCPAKVDNAENHHMVFCRQLLVSPNY